jgi:hypothetical protein
MTLRWLATNSSQRHQTSPMTVAAATKIDQPLWKVAHRFSP